MEAPWVGLLSRPHLLDRDPATRRTLTGEPLRAVSANVLMTTGVRWRPRRRENWKVQEAPPFAPHHVIMAS